MPGKKALEVKSAEVKELSEKINGAKGIAVVDYRGITVEDITSLRNELRKENVEYKVSIVDLYVRQMHGTISLESRLGEGTEVRIELPQLSVKES
jgi:ribosomal protein L10